MLPLKVNPFIEKISDLYDTEAPSDDCKSLLDRVESWGQNNAFFVTPQWCGSITATPSWLANYNIMCLKFNCRNLDTVDVYDHDDGDDNVVIHCQGRLQGNVPVGIQSFSRGHFI